MYCNLDNNQLNLIKTTLVNDLANQTLLNNFQSEYDDISLYLLLFTLIESQYPNIHVGMVGHNQGNAGTSILQTLDNCDLISDVINPGNKIAIVIHDVDHYTSLFIDNTNGNQEPVAYYFNSTSNHISSKAEKICFFLGITRITNLSKNIQFNDTDCGPLSIYILQLYAQGVFILNEQRKIVDVPKMRMEHYHILAELIRNDNIPFNRQRVNNIPLTNDVPRLYKQVLVRLYNRDYNNLQKQGVGKRSIGGKIKSLYATERQNLKNRT